MHARAYTHTHAYTVCKVCICLMCVSGTVTCVCLFPSQFPLKGCAEPMPDISSGLSKSMEDVFLQQDYTDLKALPSTKQREKEREEKSTTTSEVEEEWSVELPSPSPVRGHGVWLRGEHDDEL